VWKHRNTRVFKGTQPNTQVLLESVIDECFLWCKAGAAKLHLLLSRFFLYRSKFGVSEGCVQVKTLLVSESLFLFYILNEMTHNSLMSFEKTIEL
jgi:hypothetical protein